MEKLLQEVAHVIPVLIGGILAMLGGALQQERIKKWEKRKLLREKTQEIYEVAERIAAYAWSYNGLYIHIAVSGKTKPPETPDLPTDKLLMLVGLYQPELKVQAKEYCECVARVVAQIIPTLISAAQNKQINADEFDKRLMTPLKEVTTKKDLFTKELEKRCETYL